MGDKGDTNEKPYFQLVKSTLNLSMNGTLAMILKGGESLRSDRYLLSD
jgi:hypothetical protein